jgi:DNA polymerase-3 subunit alpha
MPKFSHLHVHTQYSLLDGAASINKLYEKAVADQMPAIAITDHGNMFGVFQFVAEASKHKNDDGTLKVKPIVGCEFYMVDDRHQKSFTKEKKDKRYHQLFLAKNEEGYKNLSKLCSLGYVEGLYSKWPRIDRELVLKYHKGLIATTCCLGAEVPQAILSKGEAEAEKIFKWWLDIFGDDYYIEMQRHDLPEQNIVNEVLLKFAAKYGTKIIASNDSHYVDEEDSVAHDILLCVNTNDVRSTPIATDEEGGKGYRFGFPNNQFFFKTQNQMIERFSDIPEAIDNTNEIVDKIDLLNLKKDILLPNFPIPEGFTDQYEYLEHLTREGARFRYSEITPEIEERLNFELFTIKTMGFSGYFLIVADFIKAGREMGVFVGPGRGSAAGSAVAYCIGITNIDPIKYDLLFERFLNPERKSMPDIDTDFDDEGRQKVIDYVVDKYGKNQVAQIVTYGTMAAKMSIKDVARALELPLSESNALAKLVPDKPGIKLHRVLRAPLTGDKSLESKEGLQIDMLQGVEKLRAYLNGKTLHSEVLLQAEKLEGSVRGTGVHAAGIIIAPDDLMNIIPVAVSKDSDLLLTQFEGTIIEDAGVIKMDFLGLKTLSIIKDALKMIKARHGVEIEIDAIPLDDEKTYELYRKGETNATFQFESPGMQKYLKDLKPDKFNDLIAMNALYRPGPIEYIPTFIKRKNGLEEIVYDMPELKEYLEDTYGITVYQEQVMLLSQKLAGFTKGQADTLRKAMGKKQKAVLDKMRPEFLEGCEKNGLPRKVCEKVWVDWEAFASYAFNKSHSTCYAFVAYQTGYLKAHYPQEYMAAVLTHSMNNLDKLSFFMKECKRMGLSVLGPEINESELHFTVNSKNQIRFGMGGIKGVGENAVISIVEERNANGPFNSIFEFASRNNLRTINKKTFEGLALAGAFDSMMDNNRAVFFQENNNDRGNFIDMLIRYGNALQQAKDSAQHSLFGEASEAEIPEPSIPFAEDWPELERLQKEKEVVGLYLTGHPLDEYEYELKNFVTNKINDIEDAISQKKLGVMIIAGIVTEARLGLINKRNEMYGRFAISDHDGSYEFFLSGEMYMRSKDYIVPGNMISAKVAIKARYGNADFLNVDLTEIKLLSNQRNTLNQVSVVVDLNHLDDQKVEELYHIIQENQGKCKVNFVILSDDPVYNKMNLVTTDYKVNISRNMLEQLEKTTGYRPTMN